jgi:hypothetical protein
MRLLQYIKTQLWNLPFCKRKYWFQRISDVLNCQDRNYINLDSNAGKIIDGLMVMHNGIKIKPLSYYGFPMLRMFKLCKGVHEPQEERVFQEVLKVMPPGAITPAN